MYGITPWRNLSRRRHAAIITPPSSSALADRLQMEVALVGDAFVDVQVGGVSQLPSWGADVSCSSVRLLPGGSCGNTARHLGSLGKGDLRASFFSCVGDDEAGAHYVRTLDTEGALRTPRDTLCILPSTPQSCCVILSGERDRAMCSCYETVHRVSMAQFANTRLLRAEDASWAHVHLGGYFNAIGMHDEDTLGFVRSVRSRGGTVSLDPQHDCSGKWTGEGGHLAQLLPHIDVFLPNETEILAIAGALADGCARPRPTTPAEALEELAEQFPTLLVVMTLGDKGLRAARGGGANSGCSSERWEVSALPIRKFVDATGAGDACAAGFLVQFLRNPSDVRLALQWGAAAGALCVSAPGACERPLTAEEVRSVIKAGAVS